MFPRSFEEHIPLAISGIPIGMAMAFSDYDGMHETGYALMGAGTAELIECLNSRRMKKEQARLKRETERLRREIKEIKELEEEEIELLSGHMNETSKTSAIS